MTDLINSLAHIFGTKPKTELKKTEKAFTEKEWDRRKKARKRAKDQRKLQRQNRKKNG